MGQGKIMKVDLPFFGQDFQVYKLTNKNSINKNFPLKICITVLVFYMVNFLKKINLLI